MLKSGLVSPNSNFPQSFGLAQSCFFSQPCFIETGMSRFAACCPYLALLAGSTKSLLDNQPLMKII